MIRLRIHARHPDRDEILEAVQQLCLAVSLEITEGDAIGPPVVWDDQRTYVGKNAILGFLEEMAQFKQEWDKFQSDTCYCDDEGEIE